LTFEIFTLREPLMKNILTADIGATNSRFAHFEVDQKGKLSLVGTQWLKTQESGSFGDLVEQVGARDFPLGIGEADIAVIAVACPVERGVYCSPPYISWDIDLSTAQKKLDLNRSFLINDFVAQAYACRSPIAEAAEQILPGQRVFNATVAVIGAGSNLGKAALVPDGSGGFVAVPSEGGHANFPFVSDREFEFQEFILRELGEEYVTANTIRNIEAPGGHSETHFEFRNPHLGRSILWQGVPQLCFGNPCTWRSVYRWWSGPQSSEPGYPRGFCD
jgi:glucokinase